MNRVALGADVATFRIEAGLWALETSEAERYDQLDDARRRLLLLARWHLALGPLALPRSGWAIEGEAPGAFWVWRIATATSSLHDRIEHARGRGEHTEVESLLDHHRRGVSEVSRVAESQALRVPLDPTRFTLIGGRCLYVGAPSTDVRSASQPRELALPPEPA